MKAIATERAAAVRHAQRAAGQASAVAAMITDQRPFADIAQQLLAARGSLDSLLVRLVELELQQCVPNPTARGKVDGVMRSAFGRTGPSRHAARSAASESQEPPAPFTVEGRTSP
jgi:DNA-binding FrmR family transcriptional regulator